MFLEKMMVKAYTDRVFARYDDKGTAYYFSAADFDGLIQTPFEFVSRLGHRMQGYFYNYPAPIEGRMVIFDHGMGGGHRSYMREIEKLAARGYLVFSYDHTGCMESGGENTNGFAQSIRDLEDCINALRADERYKDLKISLVDTAGAGLRCSMSARS